MSSHLDVQEKQMDSVVKKSTPPTSSQQGVTTTFDDLELDESCCDEFLSGSRPVQNLPPFSAPRRVGDSVRRTLQFPVDEEIESHSEGDGKADHKHLLASESDSSSSSSPSQENDLSLSGNTGSGSDLDSGVPHAHATGQRSSLPRVHRGAHSLRRMPQPQPPLQPRLPTVIVVSSCSSISGGGGSGHGRKRKRKRREREEDVLSLVAPGSKRRKLSPSADPSASASANASAGTVRDRGGGGTRVVRRGGRRGGGSAVATVAVAVPGSGSCRSRSDSDSLVILGSNGIRNGKKKKKRRRTGPAAGAQPVSGLVRQSHPSAGSDTSSLSRSRSFDLVKDRDLQLERSRNKFFEKKKKKKSKIVHPSKKSVSVQKQSLLRLVPKSLVSGKNIDDAIVISSEAEDGEGDKVRQPATQERDPPPSKPRSGSADSSSDPEQDHSPTPLDSLASNDSHSSAEFSEDGLKEVRLCLNFGNTLRGGVTDESNMTTMTNDIDQTLQEKSSDSLSAFIVDDRDVARLNEKVDATEPSNYLSKGFDRTLLRRKVQIEREREKDEGLFDPEEDVPVRKGKSKSQSRRKRRRTHLVLQPRRPARRRKRRRIVPPEDMIETHRRFTALCQYIASCYLVPDFASTVRSPADKCYFGDAISEILKKTQGKVSEFLTRSRPSLLPGLTRDLFRFSTIELVEVDEGPEQCGGCHRHLSQRRGLKLSRPCVSPVRFFEKVGDQYRFLPCPQFDAEEETSTSEVCVYRLDRPCRTNAIGIHRIHHFLYHLIRRIQSNFRRRLETVLPRPSPIALLKAFISPECALLKEFWLDWLVLLKIAIYRDGKPFEECNELIVRNALRKTFQSVQRPKNFNFLDDSDKED